jgi:hypothetical protein
MESKVVEAPKEKKEFPKETNEAFFVPQNFPALKNDLIIRAGTGKILTYTKIS